jgi:hypothetical protein
MGPFTYVRRKITMPRAKRPSDELYNERRRLKRAAARAEKQGNSELAAIYREQAQATYAKSPIDTAARATISVPQQPKPAARQPRAKRPSDEVYNARRRLRRQAERMERDAKKQSGTERALTESYAQFLREQAAAPGKLTPEQRMQTLSRLGKLRESTRSAAYGRFKVARRNAIFRQQMNAAGTEGASSSISERKKDVFWAATKGLWPKGSNVPRDERYERILDHFYNDDTTDAKEFRKWLEEKKGTSAENSYGDLQLVYEYVTEEMNDPAQYESPELPYESAMDVIKMAR